MPREENIQPTAEASIAEICQEFQIAWHASRDSVEAFLSQLNLGDVNEIKLMARLVKCEIEFLRKEGGFPRLEDYRRRFPELPVDVLDDLILMPAIPEAPPRKTNRPLMPPRYKVIESIGKGGIGSVWRVQDRVMQRPLAAKVLLDKFKTNGAANARLEREALLAGSLQHPGIPPVFERGELITGSKFFTMKLVEGDTLDVLLGQRSTPASDRPYFFGVLRQIAEAVGFAHSKGVIHRDLKPQNVMVGEFGEVQIMDWGMAKRLGESTPSSPIDLATGDPGIAIGDGANRDPVRQEEIDSHAMSLDSSLVEGRDHALTLQGDVFGTPSYMSPEQAQGNLDQLSERSDVFSLGAILFEMLTNQRLYQDVEINQLIDASADCRIESSLAKLDACGADPELIELCKKCLSREPSLRPSNGLAVAVAISDHLSGVERRLKKAELETAASEARAAESRKRLRTIVALVGIAALFAITGLTGVAWKWREANQNYRESVKQSAAREVYFSKSLDAVDQMLTRVGSEMLASVPQMSQIRRQLLNDALVFYNELLEDSPDDPTLRREFGRIQKKVGLIQSKLGDQSAAIDSFQSAVDTFDELGNEFPDDLLLLLEYCSARKLYAATIHEIGRSDEGESVLRDAIALLDESEMLANGLEPGQPEYVPWLQVRADLHASLANILPSTDSGTAAIAELERAIEYYERIPAEGVNDSVQLAYAQSLEALASFLERVNQVPRSIELRNQSIDIINHLLEQTPGSPEYQSMLANIQQAMFGMLAQQGNLPEGIAGLKQTIELRRELIADFPSIPKLKQDFARCLAQCGAALSANGDYQPGQLLLAEAVEVAERLTQEFPDTVDYLQELAYVFQTIGTSYNLSGGEENQKLSVDFQRKAYQTGKQIIELAPVNSRFKYELGMTTRNLSSSLWNSGADLDQVLTTLEEALDLFSEISKREPNNTDYLYQLAFTRTNYVNRLPASEADKARATLESAFATLEQLIALQPENQRYQHQLARAYDQLASLEYRAGALDAWESLLRKANLINEGVLEKFGPDSRNVAYATISRNRLAHCLDVRGKPAESLLLFRAALAQRQKFVDQNPENERLTRQLASSHANVAWNLAHWQPPENRDLEEALRHAELATDLDFEAAEHWTCKAHIRYRQAAYEDVNQVLAKCEAVNPPDQMARLALQAMTGWQLGDQQAAKTALAAAKQMRDSEEVQLDANARLVSPESFQLVDEADEMINE